MISFRKLKVLIFSASIKNAQFVTSLLENICHEPDILVVHDILDLKAQQKDSDAVDVLCLAGNNEEQTLLKSYIDTHKISCPLITFSQDTEISKAEGNSLLVFVSENLLIEQVNFVLRKFLENQGLGDGLDPEQEFKKVRSSFLMRFNFTKVDIYIKLSESRYVKLIKANDYYDKEQILSYQLKNIDYLYFKADDFKIVSRDIRLLPILEMAKPPEVDEESFLLQKARQSNAVLKEVVTEVGMPVESVEIVETYIDSVDKIVKQDQNLGRLLATLKARSGYFSDHSFLTAVVCSEMVRYMEEHFQQARERLLTACLFHDVLVLDEKLIKVESPKDPTCALFDNEKLEKYFRHPRTTSELVRKSGLFPGDVARIILEHHENPNATGFPHAKGAQAISPLTAVFIVAHHFVQWMYLEMFDPKSMGGIMKALKTKYSEGVYHKAFVALESCTGMRAK